MVAPHKVSIQEARSSLTQLIERVQGGQDVIITRAGRPVARLTRVNAERKGIKLGTLEGMFKDVSPDFDAPLPPSMHGWPSRGPTFLDELIGTVGT